MSLGYRPDVDGLRAVAVLPVVLFHAGIGAFSGGFVGVDVFFVISGFLITSMIAAEAREGRFSIVTFYERRVRRIFPAFFAMLFAACALAWFILPPADMNDFGQSVFSSTVFASNLLFWMQSGYFDAAAHTKPLLHTWSLAVEEQFYILFPLFLVLLYKLARTGAALVRIAVLGVLALSFVACVVMTWRNPSTAFYVAPFRAWELMIGSALAVGAVPALGRTWQRELATAAGLAMIAVAVFAYDEATQFPGFAAALPCVGAALIIHGGAGQGAREGGAPDVTLVSRLLSTAPAVFIGKISYSLYLWHWPLLVFSLSHNVEPLTPVQTASVLAASLIASVLSWRFVEQPFRVGSGAKRVWTRRPLFAAAATASVLAIVFGLATFKTKGWPQRVDERVVQLDAARKDRSPDRKRCHGEDDSPIPFAEKCRYGPKDTPPEPTVAIWGDSFAPEVGLELGKVAQQKGVSLLFASFSGCPPTLDVPGLTDVRPPCQLHNEMMLAELSKHATIHTVVLFARFETYEKRFGAPFIDGYARIATALAKAGKRVVVVYPIPRPPAHVPTLLAHYAHAGRDPHEAHIQRALWRSDNPGALAMLDRLVQTPGITPARPDAVLCDGDGDAAKCALMHGDDVLYYDENHLSLAGARFVLPAFEHIWSTP